MEEDFPQRESGPGDFSQLYARMNNARPVCALFPRYSVNCERDDTRE